MPIHGPGGGGGGGGSGFALGPVQNDVYDRHPSRRNTYATANAVRG